MDTTLLKLKNLTLLYAEDEEGIRKPIADSLRYYCKELYEARDGKEALALFKKHNPNIILTDIHMPCMDGLALSKAIRSLNKHVPIIIITAFTEKEYLLEAIDLKTEKYIVKPITLASLLEALKKCVHELEEKAFLMHNLGFGYAYDFAKHVLFYENKAIRLNKKEICFLELLIENKSRVVSYEELQEKVWQDDVMTDGAIRSLVSNLNKKLPVKLVKNLSGVGYQVLYD